MKTWSKVAPSGSLRKRSEIGELDPDGRAEIGEQVEAVQPAGRIDQQVVGGVSQLLEGGEVPDDRISLEHDLGPEGVAPDVAVGDVEQEQLVVLDAERDDPRAQRDPRAALDAPGVELAQVGREEPALAELLLVDGQVEVPVGRRRADQVPRPLAGEGAGGRLDLAGHLPVDGDERIDQGVVAGLGRRLGLAEGVAGGAEEQGGQRGAKEGPG